MTQAIACPDASDIRRLAVGQTGEPESGRLEEHLLHCDACLRRLQALPADDPLIAALRRGRASATSAPRSDLLEKLRQCLRDLGPAAAPETLSAENTGTFLPQARTPEQQPALAPPHQPDEIGRLGAYRLLKELGRGGMGVVYQAEDVKLKRLVALKAMLPNLAADATARQRFLREAQAMAAVRHDHVVTIFQVDEAGGVPFLAMEFLQGMALDRWLKAGRKATVPQVLRIGREIAEGLDAAHARGLIHRDVKPGNIWLDSSHKGRVKILDFGLARAGQEDVQLTRSGAIVGTPAYMAPEQACGGKVDARGDLFSLGCVLYQLLTGETPFSGETTMALLFALAQDHPKPVRERNPDCPAPLADLVMKLLEKYPAKRPQSAREVVQALQAIERPPAQGRATGVVPAASTPAVVRKQSAVKAPAAGMNPPTRTAPGGRKRRRWLVAAATAAFLAAAAAAVVVIIRNGKGDKVAEIRVPPGGTVQVVDDGKKAPAAAAPRESADDAWAKETAALGSTAKQREAVIARLKELNPGFDGDVKYKVEGGAITEFQLSVDQIKDISPVRALVGLRKLECIGSDRKKGQLADLSPLKHLKLTSLNCRHTRVADLAPLKGMPLTDLNCSETLVADLYPLKDMPLTNLTVAGTPVSDLSPLRGMKLTTLSAEGAPVSDLSPLKGMPLTYLHIKGTRVSDLSALKGLPLTYLQVGQTNVSDLSPLKDMKLETLMCYATKVTDLSPVKEMPLKWIVCYFEPDRDAKLLRSIKTLERINDRTAAELWKELDEKKSMSTVRPTVTDAWCKEVAALSTAKQREAVVARLKELNPGFDGNLTVKVMGGVITELEMSAMAIRDLSPLRALPGLRRLVCRGIDIRYKSPLADLSPLQGMSLTELDCSCSHVLDLSPLKGMKLTCLDCGCADVNDLSPLKGMPLQRLGIDGNPINDLSPVKGMPLTELRCSATRILDLSPLKGMRLQHLGCAATGISDLSPLKDMPLTYLHILNTPVTDLSPLKGMPLTWLHAQNTPVADLSPLKGMPLAWLSCEGTRVSDLSPLSSMPLKELWLAGTPVSDLSPLKGMPLMIVNIPGTKVSDLAPLKGMKLIILNCSGTRVSDLSPLKDMPLKDLGCDFQPKRDAAILRSIPTLERINGKPAAEVRKEADAKLKGR